jgi:Spy/CpxP family protein refolding chaperone
MSWTRTKTLSVVLFVSLAFNLFWAGTMVGRWGWHGGDHGEVGRHFGAKFWLGRALGDEAAPKVEKMWEAHRTKMKPLREESKQARAKIHATLAATPFDSDAYAEALAASLDRRMAIRASHHAFMIELAEILTPEQRAKLAEYASHERRRHHRR